MTTQEELIQLRKENKYQREEIKLLTEKVTILLKLVEDLGHKKNSRNSSISPSIDMTRKNKSLRGRSNKKSGGQKGHEGSTLLQVDNPDLVTNLKSNYCRNCGGSLSDSDFVLQSKRQVVDIPPVKPVYHEYRQYSCSCPHCREKHLTDFPPNISAPIQYGNSIQSLVSYMSVYQYVPYARLAEMFSQVYNIPLCQGSIMNILIKAASKAEVVYDKIKEELAEAKIIGSDETGAKVNGDKAWIWVWQNPLNTYLVASKSRGYKTINNEWKDGFPIATLISDRLSAQLKTPALLHQVCLAHLLREIIFIEEVENHPFTHDFKELLIKIFEFKKNQKSNYSVASLETSSYEEKINELLAICISKKDYPKTTTFQKSMIRVRNYILPCLYDKEIPPDNNGSERAVRNVKVKQKISGQFKTGQGPFCILRSVIDTLKKRKCNILSVFNEIMRLEQKVFLEPG